MLINGNESNSMFPSLPTEIKAIIFSYCGTAALKVLTSVSKESSILAGDTLFRRYLPDKIKALKSFIVEIDRESDSSLGYEALCLKLNTVYQKAKLGDLIYADRKGPIQKEHEQALKLAIDSQLKQASLKLKASKERRHAPQAKLPFPWEFFEKPIMDQQESISLSMRRMGLNDSDISPLLRLLDSKKIVSLDFTTDNISEKELLRIKERFPSIQKISGRMILDLSDELI